jgi:hypothetical protein
MRNWFGRGVTPSHLARLRIVQRMQAVNVIGRRDR